MFKQIPRLLAGWLGAVATGADVVAATQIAGLVETTGIAGPFILGAAGPYILGVIGIGLGIWSTYEAFKSWSEGKRTEEIWSHIYSQSAGLRGASEELEIQHGAVLSDLASDDARRPWLVLSGAIQRDLAAFTNRLETGLNGQTDLLRQVGSFLIQQQGLLLQEVELVRDDLVDLQQWLKEEFKSLAEIHSSQCFGPRLELGLISSTDSPRSERLASRFHFRRRRVSFVGRQQELLDAERFLLTTNSDVKWWLWTGSGGIGKSRLALELCLRAQASGWWAGFLRSSKQAPYSDWERFRIEQPTLIVVDYLSGRAGEIGQAIATLMTRSEPIRHPIRFLLLERGLDEQIDSWWREFSRPGSARDAIEVDNARFGPHWDLPPLNEDAIWAILSSVLHEQSQLLHDRQVALDHFRNIDRQTRPLLAIAFAEAWQETSPSDLDLNPNQLSALILVREVDHWKSIGVDEPHLNLLTYATLTGGHNNESYRLLWELLSPQVRELLPKPEEVNTTWMHAMTSFGDDDAISNLQSPPFEPDLLGEVLVLQRLEGDLGIAISQPSRETLSSHTQMLVEAAWQLEAEQCAAFTIRTWNDAGGHSAADRLLTSPPQTLDASRDWALAACHVVPEFIKFKRDETDRRVVLGIEELVERDRTSIIYLAAYYAIRGITYGEMGDIDRARADFTTCIKLPGAPPDQVANALAYRGVTYCQTGDVDRELADYTACVELPGASPELVARALVYRGMTYRQKGQMDLARTDFTACIELPDAPPELVAKGLVYRGATYGQTDDLDLALADFTTCIELSGAPPELVAKALFNRGVRYDLTDDLDRALADFTTCIDLPGAPPDQVAKALFNRGVRYGKFGDVDLALADFTACIELPGAPLDQVAKGLVYRGAMYGQTNDLDLALADFTTCIELSGAPPDQVANALVCRSITYRQAGDTDLARTDFTTCIDLPGAPPELVAKALVYRGVTYGETGDVDRELANYTACVELPDAPPELVARALVYRGTTYRQKGEMDLARTDFTACIDLPGAPPELVAKGLVYRGAMYGQTDDLDRELSDYTACIELPGVPPELVARALVYRGITYDQMGDVGRALADYTACIDLPGAPPDLVAEAVTNRSRDFR